ncbi:Crp/Fnr family transcriptional regulator [Nocardioides marmotae]|uniref:Cyclic nucleotide-binding domain-containing protein n=1 Tax=Nocardioides marmotae TaxID=2663857 RepID=A0A6I3IXZ5_9ACTN|nr:Crp/Fnr family transcriptional regulator [Nocardioides marmotae]MBC9732837.1 Crp/Fnr family transcriptional regulator [Nocardioides marmotae]MCR6029881.1 cyclic nucleotide-binding domain-containing protein [Gordonia jinghuaiqii]MTB93511.1 cyclic nucleotide-binding domain-containing protein [Nocardioides marmotae]QKD99887.1 Crp/Fnr family transcriptional regulator [Nocardioides marmotae]
MVLVIERFHSARPAPSAPGHLLDLDDPVLREVLAAFETRRLDPNERLFEQGEPGRSLCLVQEGSLKLTRTTAAGRANLLAVLGPGDTVGEMSLLDGNERHGTVTALAPSVVLELSQARFDRWLLEQPAAAPLLLQHLSRRLRTSNDVIADLVFADVPTRVARLVLKLADQLGARDERDIVVVEHQLTQEELAQLVGAARETVNKALSNFARRGWLELGRRSLTVLDVDRLRRFAL